MPFSITISKLSKHYKVPEREAGLKASIASLFNRKYKTVRAVDEISFNIEPGAGGVGGSQWGWEVGAAAAGAGARDTRVGRNQDRAEREGWLLRSGA